MKKSPILVLFVTGMALAAPASGASVIVDNLGSATTVSGIKNANPGTVSQGFTMKSNNGYLNGLTLELGIIHTTAAENSSETMSVYLYGANSNGVPTGSALATLATGITVGNIKAGTSEGYTANNTSDIYEYAVTLSNSPSLTVGTNYAIEISLSSGTQSIGWAHSTGVGSGELGEIYVDSSGTTGPGYGEMEITTVTNLNLKVAPRLSIVPQAGGSVNVSASGGVSGQTYVLQSSMDTVNWTAVRTNTADSTGASTFLSLCATNCPRCYYRIATP